jgi:hypothetical protein
MPRRVGLQEDKREVKKGAGRWMCVKKQQMIDSAQSHEQAHHIIFCSSFFLPSRLHSVSNTMQPHSRSLSSMDTLSRHRLGSKNHCVHVFTGFTLSIQELDTFFLRHHGPLSVPRGMLISVYQERRFVLDLQAILDREDIKPKHIPVFKPCKNLNTCRSYSRL